MRAVLARHRAVLVCSLALTPAALLVAAGLLTGSPSTGLVPLPAGGRVPLWVVALAATCLLLSPLLAPDVLVIEAASVFPRRLLLAPLALGHLTVAVAVAPLVLAGLLVGAVGLAAAFLSVALAASAAWRALGWVATAPAYVGALVLLADRSVYESPVLLGAGLGAWAVALAGWWLRYRRLPVAER